MDDNKEKIKISDYTNYIIIGIACLIMGLIPPLLGTVTGLGIHFPTTSAGWLVWAVLHASNTISNCLIYYAFTTQGKENAKNTTSYNKAITLLSENNVFKEKILISPQEWEKRGWSKKILWLVIGTFASSVALTQAVLAFDVVRFISQIVILTFGLLFGLVQMKKTEEKYSSYYLEYAEQRVRLKKDEDNKIIEIPDKEIE